jgi:hypothetical protein
MLGINYLLLYLFNVFYKLSIFTKLHNFNIYCKINIKRSYLPPSFPVTKNSHPATAYLRRRTAANESTREELIPRDFIQVSPRPTRSTRLTAANSHEVGISPSSVINAATRAGFISSLQGLAFSLFFLILGGTHKDLPAALSRFSIQPRFRTEICRRFSLGHPLAFFSYTYRFTNRPECTANQPRVRYERPTTGSARPDFIAPSKPAPRGSRLFSNILHYA